MPAEVLCDQTPKGSSMTDAESGRRFRVSFEIETPEIPKPEWITEGPIRNFQFEEIKEQEQGS
jgi:hypothetical protein